MSRSDANRIVVGFRLAVAGIGAFAVGTLLEFGPQRRTLGIVPAMADYLGLFLLAAGAAVAASAKFPHRGRPWLWVSAALSLAALVVDGLQRLAFTGLVFRIPPLALYAAALAILGLTIVWLADYLRIWYRRTRALVMVGLFFVLTAAAFDSDYGSSDEFGANSPIRLCIVVSSLFQIVGLLRLAREVRRRPYDT